LTVEKVKEIIKKYNPDKIFTHTFYDMHPHHRAVHKIVTKATDQIKNKDYPIYTFDVWDVGKTMNIIKEDCPKLVVDISETFDKKIKAIKLFKSQKVYTYSLLPQVYINAITNGKKNNCKYAEMFYKIR
jgi:LmbE family N-acetylglucosaminyl deacetylase